jgi:hypothetical protein
MSHRVPARLRVRTRKGPATRRALSLLEFALQANQDQQDGGSHDQDHDQRQRRQKTAHLTSPVRTQGRAATD